jgi:hypothetical protein
MGLVGPDLDLLPDRVEEIEATFFSTPPLNRLDGLLKTALKVQASILPGLKAILKPGNRRPPGN